MLLGSAVQEVVQHLQMQPPTIEQITDPGLRAIQPKPSNNHSSSSSSSSFSAPTAAATLAPAASLNHNNRRQSSSEDAPPDYETFAQTSSSPPPEPASMTVNVPDLPDEFRKLEGMEREELEHLLKDHIALVAFCNDLPFTKQLNEKRMSVLQENITKAEANLEKKQELETLHAQVKELQKKLKEQVDDFQKLEKKQNSMCSVPDTRTVLKELHKSKKEAFEKSEQLADEWLEDGATDVKDFCRRFIEARKVHHVRAGKMEVLQHQNDC